MPEAIVYDLARDSCFLLSRATDLKIATIDRN